jgi:alkaline phosphatase D
MFAWFGKCRKVSPPTFGFIHGVASFDPTDTSVLIWTRLTINNGDYDATQNVIINTNARPRRPSPPDSSSPVVDWQISQDPTFSTIQAQGKITTSPNKDYTCCVDVTGLQVNTRYFYRFIYGQHISTVGRTRTFGIQSSQPIEELTFGLVSCANWGFGYFNVYDLLSKVDDLDFVLHAGDYIYEYGKYDYPDRIQNKRHGLRPKHGCDTVDDYRQRYQTYRTDPGLQRLHAAVPMFATVDDHEVADEAYKSGAADGDVAEGKKYSKKQLAGLRAYLEWVPVRGGRADDPSTLSRSFKFGNLATLIMPENRHAYRDKPVEYAETEFYKQTAKKAEQDWDDGAIKIARKQLMKDLRDPHRAMLGDKQMRTIKTAVEESVAQGQPWQIFLSQTIFSPITAPRLEATVSLQPRFLRALFRKALATATNDKIVGKEAAELTKMYLALGRYKLPMNEKAWDGYQAERQRVLDILSHPNANAIILAGDSHNAWAHEVKNGAKSAAVEFDGPAVTSIGFWEDIYSRIEQKLGRIMRLWPVYLFSPWAIDALKAANPDTLDYANLSDRGFVLCRATHAYFHTEFHYVNNLSRPVYKNYVEAAFDVEAGRPGVLRRGVRYMSIDGSIPKRRMRKSRWLVQATHDISLGMNSN